MSGGGSRAVTILARVSLGFFALLGVGHIAMLAMRPEVRGMGPDACDRSQSESGKIISDLTRSVLGDAPVFDDWTGLCTYAAANAALLKSGQPVEMVFIGDSLTQQWGDVDPALFGNARPNRGISGQSSVEVLARVPSDVVALRPRVMHVLAGTNDVLGVRGPSTPARWQGTMRAIVDIARAEGIAVILGTLPPMARNSFDPDHRPAPLIAEQNRFLAALAKEKGAVLADYHAVLTASDGGFAAGMASDEVHISPKGYAAMRKVLEEALAKLPPAAKN